MAFKLVLCVFAIALLGSNAARVESQTDTNIPVSETPTTTPAGQVMSATQLHQGGYGGYHGSYPAPVYQGTPAIPAAPTRAADLHYPQPYYPETPYYGYGSDSGSSEERRRHYEQYHGYPRRY